MITPINLENHLRQLAMMGRSEKVIKSIRRMQSCRAPLLKTLSEISEPIMLHAGGTKIEVYIEYWRRCNQAGVVPVSARTIYRWLRRLPARHARSQLPHFTSVDETTMDFTINDEVSS